MILPGSQNPRHDNMPQTTDTASTRANMSQTHEPILRTFQPGDQAAVLRLYSQGLLTGCIDSADTAADLDYIPQAYFSDPADHFWVAEVDGQVVGMIGVAHEEGGVSMIRRLRVDPAWQDKQLAAALIETALKHCRTSGALKVVLDTHVDVERARHLLSTRGFHHFRSRSVNGKDLLEFYVDLYHDPSTEAREPGAAPPRG